MDKSKEPVKRGILYAATGKKCLAEAIVSVKSVRRYMPEIATAIYTDYPEEAKGYFDEVYNIQPNEITRLNKIDPLSQSPFDQTLYLDSDTYVCDDLTELFLLLDKFDLCIAHAPYRKNAVNDRYIPEAFPQLNSGVMLYRKSHNTAIFFHKWRERFLLMLESHSKTEDQFSLREVIYESELRIYILPPEYNIRIPDLSFACANMKVKVIHGRSMEPEVLAQQMNSYYKQTFRLFLPNVRYLNTISIRLLGASKMQNKIIGMCFKIARFLTG